MFKWKPEEERAKHGPHEWTRSTLGHGETMCKLCAGTNRELAVIGDLDHCEKNPPAAPSGEKE